MTIKSNTLIMLCPNDYRISDFSELKQDAIVGIRKRGQGQELYEVLKKFFKLEPRMILLDDDDIVPLYKIKYHVYFAYTAIRPGIDPYIAGLTERAPSHLLSFTRLNGGDYFVTDDERPFYTANPHFKKFLLENHNLDSLYPYLTLDTRLLYIPTITEGN